MAGDRIFLNHNRAAATAIKQILVIVFPKHSQSRHCHNRFTLSHHPAILNVSSLIWVANESFTFNARPTGI